MGRQRIVRSGVAIAATMLLISAISALVLPGSAGATTPTVAPSPIIGPGSNDPFYAPPADFASKAPGTILKTRPVTLKELELLPIHAQAWQLLYRTTGANGQPYASVTTVMIPDGPARPRPLLSYQMAYDSMQRACMPSYAMTHANPLNLLQPPPNAAWSLPPMEVAVAAAGVEKGWAVAIPDASGIDNRFITPRVMGYTTLDGIRAAEHFAPLGLSGTKTRTAMMGYSGGAITTDWAAELQPKYAPELNIAGAAMGAPVPDFAKALRDANGRLLAGLIPLGVSAIAKDSPEFTERINQYLTPRGKQIMADSGNQCLNRTVLKNLFLQAPQLLNKPLDQVLADPVIHQAVEERNRPKATPTVPMYIFNAVHDEVSDIHATDAMVEDFCSNGASVTYVRDDMPDIVSDHTIEAMTGTGSAFAWIEKALTGPTPVQPAGCRISTVPTSLTQPGSLSDVPPIITASVKTILGMPLGQN